MSGGHLQLLATGVITQLQVFGLLHAGCIGQRPHGQAWSMPCCPGQSVKH